MHATKADSDMDEEVRKVWIEPICMCMFKLRVKAQVKNVKGQVNCKMEAVELGVQTLRVTMLFVTTQMMVHYMLESGWWVDDGS